MAIAEFTLTIDGRGNIRMPVTITNPKNNKSIKLNMLPDTGAGKTFLDGKHGRTLGLNISSGTPIQVSSGTGSGRSGTGATGPVATDVFEHTLLVKIGNLKPVATPVMVKTTSANFPIEILGMYTMLQFTRVTYPGNGKIRFEQADTVPTVKKTAAYAYTLPAWYSYRKRI